MVRQSMEAAKRQKDSRVARTFNATSIDFFTVQTGFGDGEHQQADPRAWSVQGPTSVMQFTHRGQHVESGVNKRWQ